MGIGDPLGQWRPPRSWIFTRPYIPVIITTFTIRQYPNGVRETPQPSTSRGPNWGTCSAWQDSLNPRPRTPSGHVGPQRIVTQQNVAPLVNGRKTRDGTAEIWWDYTAFLRR